MTSEEVITTIDEEPILVRFLRVRCGTEETVAASLAKSHSKALICSAFGAADLVVISQESWSLATELASPDASNDVLDLRPYRCFSWAGCFAWDEILNAGSGLMGLSFIRLSDASLREFGIRAEAQAARWLSTLAKGFPNLSCNILGTLGWFGLLAITSCSNLNVIQDFVLALRSNRDSEPFRVKVDLTSTTIASTMHPREAPLSATFGEVKPTLYVGCSPWADGTVSERLATEFGDQGPVNWSFGANDFVCQTTGNQSVQSYLEKLRRVRRTEGVIRTFTVLAGPIGVLHKRGRERANLEPPSLGLDPNHERVRKLAEKDPSLSILIRSVYDLLGRYLREPRTAATFVDLVPYANRIRSEVLGTETWRTGDPVPEGDPIENTDRLYLATDLLQHAIQQRASGMASLWDRDSSGYPYPVQAGGVHKAIGALTAIARSSAARLGIEWDGFVVIGFTGDFRRYSGSVINAPWHALDQVDSWFPIGHEIGHEYGVRRDVVGDPSTHRLLRQARLTDRRSQVLLWEVLSELVGCGLTAGLEDWYAYRQLSWRYIWSHPSSKNPDRLREIFARFLICEMYVRSMKGGGRSSRAEPIAKELLGIHYETRRRAEVVHPDASLPILETERGDALRRKESFVNAARVADRLIGAGLFDWLKRYLPSDLSNGPGSEEIEFTANLLSSGTIIDDAEPFVLLRALRQDGESSTWRAGTTALLSLWSNSTRSNTMQT